MSSLRGSSERAVYQAMFELMDGGLTHRVDGELEIETEEGRYRFIDGVCFGAPSPDRVGAALAGWLVESERASAVLTRWRRGAFAVLARDGAFVRVTGPSLSLRVDGAFVEDGFATHDGRLVFAHEKPPARAPEPSADPVIELHGAVVMTDLEIDSYDPRGEDEESFDPPQVEARVTAPPSPVAEEVLSSERALRAATSEPPPDDTEPSIRPHRRSHAAPPAWELPRVPRMDPLPSFPLDLMDGLEDELDTSPRVLPYRASR